MPHENPDENLDNQTVEPVEPVNETSTDTEDADDLFLFDEPDEDGEADPADEDGQLDPEAEPAEPDSQKKGNLSIALRKEREKLKAQSEKNRELELELSRQRAVMNQPGHYTQPNGQQPQQHQAQGQPMQHNTGNPQLDDYLYEMSVNNPTQYYQLMAGQIQNSLMQNIAPMRAPQLAQNIASQNEVWNVLYNEVPEAANIVNEFVTEQIAAGNTDQNIGAVAGRIFGVFQHIAEHAAGIASAEPPPNPAKQRLTSAAGGKVKAANTVNSGKQLTPENVIALSRENPKRFTAWSQSAQGQAFFEKHPQFYG